LAYFRGRDVPDAETAQSRPLTGGDTGRIGGKARARASGRQYQRKDSCRCGDQPVRSAFALCCFPGSSVSPNLHANPVYFIERDMASVLIMLRYAGVLTHVYTKLDVQKSNARAIGWEIYPE
jgi:hypothetical protein